MIKEIQNDIHNKYKQHIIAIMQTKKQKYDMLQFEKAIFYEAQLKWVISYDILCEIIDEVTLKFGGRDCEIMGIPVDVCEGQGCEIIKLIAEIEI